MNQKEVDAPLGKKTLEAENAWLRARVKELESRVETASAAKADFLANVSHRLRTPLAAMTLWTKLLAEENEPDAARWREGLEAIRSCAAEQQQLIDDLLFPARPGPGKQE